MDPIRAARLAVGSALALLGAVVVTAKPPVVDVVGIADSSDAAPATQSPTLFNGTRPRYAESTDVRAVVAQAKGTPRVAATGHDDGGDIPLTAVFAYRSAATVMEAVDAN